MSEGRTQEIISFLKDPQNFRILAGADLRAYCCRTPPERARLGWRGAIAGEATCLLCRSSLFRVSDFGAMFVGVGASRVRDLFEQGKKNAPCIFSSS